MHGDLPVPSERCSPSASLVYSRAEGDLFLLPCLLPGEAFSNPLPASRLHHLEHRSSAAHLVPMGQGAVVWQTRRAARRVLPCLGPSWALKPSPSLPFSQPDCKCHVALQVPLPEQQPSADQQPAERRPQHAGESQPPAAAAALHFHASAYPVPEPQEYPHTRLPLPGPGLGLAAAGAHNHPVGLGPRAGPYALLLRGSIRGRLPAGEVAQVFPK